MNQNIEVINSKLWAVRFSLLQYIQEIEYKPDPEFATDREFGRISKDGILVLNKDFSGYKWIMKFLPNLMRKSNKYLFKELKKHRPVKHDEVEDIVYKSCLVMEIERRNKEMG